MQRLITSKNGARPLESKQPKTAPRRSVPVNGKRPVSTSTDATQSKEGDLARAALLYAVECAVLGD
ncbi:MAG: hypothetical protein OXP09_21085, partial [Gammaproteobacteria bacterium]|nr:hypothetical protein [Gammaproteobacteria bacterium]